MPRLAALFAASAAVALAACGPSAPPDGAPAPAATAADITPADLRTRLYIYADDSMQGRQSGTVGGMKATDYLAAEAKRLGLEPAGDEGTYFQDVPLNRRQLDSASAIAAGGVTLRPWDDFIPRDQGHGTRSLDGVEVVDGGTWTDGGPGPDLIPMEAAAGKLVVIRATPAGTVNRAVVTARFQQAAGIAVATLDAIGRTERHSLAEAGAQLAGGGSGHSSSGSSGTPAFLYVTTEGAQALLDAGRVTGDVTFNDTRPAEPVRNVVAILRGSDPLLRDQFVAVGSHNDHEGIAAEAVDHDSLRAFNRVMRPRGANDSPGEPTAEEAARIRGILDSLRGENPPRRDSIMNGADDDGSGSVAMLEIAERLARGSERPRRSVLFVWHAAEEMGLLGANHFTRTPTVPRDSIVTGLNIDMIGRGGGSDLGGGGPNYVLLIGSRRLSTELGDLVERTNQEGGHGFTFDYTYDADGHPDNFYCRSDHAMYARYGIPVTFFSTGSHLDYHQVTDEPQYIDYEKLARVTRLIADVTLDVANLDEPPTVDGKVPDPEAPCRQ